jgi:hypothetical protein
MQLSRLTMTPPRILEDRLKLAAQRLGLRIIADRYSPPDAPKYLLRPYWNARRAVQVRPDGSYGVTQIWRDGRRQTASRFSLEEIEALLADWDQPNVCEPTRLPWQALSPQSAPAAAAQHQR